MSFEDKVVWVTGASSGIGEALVRAAAGRGASVIASGRRVAELKRVTGDGTQALVLPFEVTDYAALPGVVEKAWDWQGRVDVLVNNAGISQRSLALDTDFEVYRRLIEIDYLAPVALTQLVLPRMVERRSGHIAVVSSVAGKVGSPLRTGYSGAKHAIVGYFDSLRAEVEAAYGIGVSVVLPGSVRTSIAVNALTGDGSARGRSDANIDAGMDPAAVAETILDGIDAGKPEIVVADGRELGALQLRAQDPQRLFAALAQEGARLASLRTAGHSPDPAEIRGREK
ncbi:MAG TPA: SDR family NAD(P)-dependent oxidoreductase [Burkholderiales bacterium]|jgi:short-subunit dehydrogenase|nr:SDR family NAD(P)-dependent oxidoreductase [Burkholderiales bacterium]